MTTPQREPIHRILFPTDFSEASNPARDYAERLAAETGAEVIVLHVFGIPDVWATGGRPEEVDEPTKQRLLEIQPQRPGVTFQHLAHGGRSGEVICWVAQDRQCDLIVMGTHGHTGLAHLLLGSVAEYVVRHARCPVLTVRPIPEDEQPLREPEVYLPMPPVM